jgi:hypothetical protein
LPGTARDLVERCYAEVRESHLHLAELHQAQA